MNQVLGTILIVYVLIGMFLTMGFVNGLYQWLEQNRHNNHSEADLMLHSIDKLNPYVFWFSISIAFCSCYPVAMVVYGLGAIQSQLED
jgi:hypothetical protein